MCLRHRRCDSCSSLVCANALKNSSMAVRHPSSSYRDRRQRQCCCSSSVRFVRHELREALESSTSPRIILFRTPLVLFRGPPQLLEGGCMLCVGYAMQRPELGQGHFVVSSDSIIWTTTFRAHINETPVGNFDSRKENGKNKQSKEVKHERI